MEPTPGVTRGVMPGPAGEPLGALVEPYSTVRLARSEAVENDDCWRAEHLSPPHNALGEFGSVDIQASVRQTRLPDDDYVGLSLSA